MAEIVRSGTPTPDDDDVPEDLQKRSIAADDRHSSSSSPKYSVKNPSKKLMKSLKLTRRKRTLRNEEAHSRGHRVLQRN